MSDSRTTPIHSNRLEAKYFLGRLVFGASILMFVACANTANVSEHATPATTDSNEEKLEIVKVISTYLDALKAQEYIEAYSYWSDSVKTQDSQEKFVELMTRQDSIGGPLARYEITSVKVGLYVPVPAGKPLAKALVSVNTISEKGFRLSGGYTLIKENDKWTIIGSGVLK